MDVAKWDVNFLSLQRLAETKRFARAPMSLAVILVNWHDDAQTLRRAAAVKTWATLAPALVIVDNESTDTSRGTLLNALSPGELICNAANLGYGGGNNRGIERALETKAQYLLLLNGDARVSEGTVARLIRRLEAHPEISILGPVIHELHHASERCYIGGRDISRSLHTRILADKDDLERVPGYPLHEVDYVPGIAFLVRRAVFETIGLFDESFFFSGEAADLCKRARDMGYRSFIDLEVSAQHDARLTPRSVRDTLYAYYGLRNRMLYGRKHNRTGLAKHLAFWAMMCLLECGKAAARGEMGRARAILLALAHGFANRSGNQNAAFV